MNCEEAIKLMNGYLDNELDPLTSQRVQEHLRDCGKCDDAFKAHGSLIKSLTTATPYYKAPAGLRKRIQSSLRLDLVQPPLNSPQAGHTQFAGNQRTVRRALPGTSWSWLALAAAVICAAIIISQVVSLGRGSGTGQLLATELIASHVRSLMANHLTDVASSDQHTVKPWLDTKIDFAPPVIDLATQGFPLLGGRLDYLDQREVVALIYQRRKHFINLFIWPIAGSKATLGPNVISRQGYHLLHWADPDFNYWAVSDVNTDDLQTFKQQFEVQTSHH
jgi:anti-sigma factor RsiW